MSHKATNWAVAQRGISPVAKVLLWQLADRHNPDNGCFPDIKTLMSDSEMSRATVIRTLSDLQERGLVRRVKRVHPVTKKQMPNRYILAFEDEFADAADDQPETESQFETRESESRVSNSGKAESQIEAEPGITGETPYRSLTGKLTSKLTKARDVRAQRESDFKTIWKLFPERPGSNELAAWEAFEKLDKADATKCVSGVERFAAHFREQGATSPKSLEERLQFVKFLSNWIAEKGWIAALRLPVKAMPGTDAAKALEGIEWVNKFSHARLFKACEKVKGKPVPVGSTGNWGFPREVVAEARALLDEPATGDPP